MRFSYFTSLAFVASVLAAPVVTLQAADIEDVASIVDGYNSILNNAKQQTALIQNLKAGDDVISALKQMSTLSASTTAIASTMEKQLSSTPGKLSTAAATKVAKPAADAAAATTTIIDILVTKKDLFVQAGVLKNVGADLNVLYKDATAFVDVAKTKIPDQYAALAAGYFQQLLDSLQKGIKAFA